MQTEDQLSIIVKKLEAIESLLQRLPEIQSVAFIQFWEEYQSARMTGKKAEDLWTIPEPNQR